MQNEGENGGHTTQKVVALGEHFAVDEQISRADLHRRNDDDRIAASSWPARSVALVTTATQRTDKESDSNAHRY